VARNNSGGTSGKKITQNHMRRHHGGAARVFFKNQGNHYFVAGQNEKEGRRENWGGRDRRLSSEKKGIKESRVDVYQDLHSSRWEAEREGKILRRSKMEGRC